MTIKLYQPIQSVSAFGQSTAPGPLLDTLIIAAIVTSSEDCLEQRISISHPDIVALSLTVEQAAQLEDRLARARADVDAASDAEQPTKRTMLASMPRCECCCQRIELGTEIAVFEDAWVHWGPCPTVCARLIKRPVYDGIGWAKYVDRICYRDAIATTEDGVRVCGLCVSDVRHEGKRIKWDEEACRG